MTTKPNLVAETRIECGVGRVGDILPVDIASTKAARAAVPVERTQLVALRNAHGRILAEPVSSRVNVPPFNNSAMDGYAVNASAFAQRGPWQLDVSDRLVAGDISSKRIAIAQAARIMTGASMPEGTDTVIMQEACTRKGDTILISDKPTRGRHVRISGEDVRKGTRLLDVGATLSPAKQALLAASGLDSVTVFDRVRIGLISTGSELIEPGEALRPGKIFNSNRYYLLSRLNRPWIEIVDYGMVQDDTSAIRALVRKAAQSCDILISTGGVSAGEEDHMLDVLGKENAALDVLKVAMRPGKPVTVGRLDKTLYLGLPGNPYAAAVTFEKIGWPAILVTGGIAANTPDSIHAVCGFDLDRKSGRTEYVPVTWSELDKFGRPIVKRLGKGSSASLKPLANARGFGILLPDQSRIRKGAEIRVDLIEQ